MAGSFIIELGQEKLVRSDYFQKYYQSLNSPEYPTKARGKRQLSLENGSLRSCHYLIVPTKKRLRA
jgi:hypothetical protein